MWTANQCRVVRVLGYFVAGLTDLDSFDRRVLRYQARERLGDYEEEQRADWASLRYARPEGEGWAEPAVDVNLSRRGDVAVRVEELDVVDEALVEANGVEGFV